MLGRSNISVKSNFVHIKLTILCPGMLNSFNSPAFQLSCLRFLNTFISSASSSKERVHIQCELEEAGLDIVLLNRMADSNQLKEELQTWTRAYIDVNQLVEENRQLRLETEELRSSGKELQERVSMLESSKNYMEDTQRWVEGSSDKERKEENLNYRSVNTVVISCNAEPSVGVRRFPRRSRVSRVEVTDTSDSDKSSLSEKQAAKEENTGTRVEVKVGGEGMTRQLEGELSSGNGQFMGLRGSLGSQPVTALNRCKSFFGLRSYTQYQGRMGDSEGLMQNSNGDSFVLKGDSGCGRREVKRSRSMDVLKSRVLRRQGSRSRGEEEGLGRGERDSYRSKHEYVSNWAREAFLSGAVQEEANRAGGREQNLMRPPSNSKDALRPLDSFYSLYYPGDSMGVNTDQEPTYLSMTNNNLPRGFAAKFESDYY